MLASQITASFVEVKEGVISLLRKCLGAENQGISHFALCGYIDHFQSQDGEDVGWGCGWRNIQMLSSNLLSEDPNAKATLFGGAGFVPNIQALQQWLEIAWARGFDPPGADHFGWKIYGTTKWIGTTECASLFRSFGLRAQIFDFMTGHCDPTVDNQSPSNSQRHSGHPDRNVLQSINQNRLSSNVVHWNVQCDNCGVYPIHGPRFKSTNREDYDLCALCVSHQSNSLGMKEFHSDYVRIEKPAEASGWIGGKGSDRNESGPHKKSKSGSSHQQLVDWVWQYFTTSNALNSPNTVDHPTLSLTKGKRPLYFQHQGHSRTIVGIQRCRKNPEAPEEVFLLVLDPSQKTDDLSRALKCNRGWQRLVKRGVHTLHKAEYQLFYVDPGIADAAEFEQLKAISSIPYHY
ncbi:hypothetical protein O6H91_08G105000 [Diphasiastrum complanatum]|nr:hypothetical protein O6H91_08G105000 [Diphasiastrum complanatum]